MKVKKKKTFGKKKKKKGKTQKNENEDEAKIEIELQKDHTVDALIEDHSANFDYDTPKGSKEKKKDGEEEDKKE